jgi:hypothetical protein
MLNPVFPRLGASMVKKSRRDTEAQGRQKAEGRRQKAERRRQKAESRKQKAERRRQKAESRKQKAEGRKQSEGFREVRAYEHGAGLRAADRPPRY